MRPSGPQTSWRPAAVLLPIIAAGSEPTVLFTRRTPHLARHAGQVSFPGGRAHDEDDLDLVATALRETHEETGIATDFVSVAGFLESYETGHRLCHRAGGRHAARRLRARCPIRARWTRSSKCRWPSCSIRPTASAKAPNGSGRAPRILRLTNMASHYIWGATAAILVNFTERLGAP